MANPRANRQVDSGPLQCCPVSDLGGAVRAHTRSSGPWAVSARYPFARAASSVAVSMSVKVAVSILSIKGPVSRPIGPPLGTYL